MEPKAVDGGRERVSGNRQASVELIQLLVTRLGRISPDSPWAYKASGLRGSLLRCLDLLEARPRGDTLPSAEQVLDQSDWLVDYGFEILEKVARREA
jgi:hypothetical protein